MKVLLLGHRSFAATGLKEQLIAAGHDVICFCRGSIGQEFDTVTGSVFELDTNPHLQKAFDVIINYIVLKDELIDQNVRFMASLAKLCQQQKVQHLIHISSVSSFRGGVTSVSEDSPTETIPLKKGAYGSLKVAQDLYLMEHLGSQTKLSLVRPGFILGPGVINPIVGTAARLPWNKTLIIGNAHSIMPMIRRDDVHQTLVKLIASPPNQSLEVFLLVANNSPTRRNFIDACCRRMGIGLGVVTVPVFVWYGIAICAEITARLLGQGKMQPYAKLSARLANQAFNSHHTQNRLNLDFTFDWETVLQSSLESQRPNVELLPVPKPLPVTKAKSITFLGFGRIVKQKHLPALKKLGFHGQINAYDIRQGTDQSGRNIQAIQGASLAPSDLFVVASPGPAHIAALDSLRQVQGPILIEKPVGYTTSELQQWMEFARTRLSPVYVCHNYRFKHNVLKMAETLQKYNPGELKHVHVHFHSPSVSQDSAAWLRNERKARTLLMDYSLHFLDLACMFGRGDWKIDGLRHEMDSHHNTGLIEGRLVSNYSVSLLLRQGFGPRRARILYSFQNYHISLGFFPDTFAVYMADDNPWLHKAESKASFRATVAKIRDKLLNKENDFSHAEAFSAALGDSPELADSIKINSLYPFYQMLFQLSTRVYGQ